MLETTGTNRGYRPAQLAVILIVVIAAVLRLHGLGAQSVWLDEAVSWYQAKDSFVELLRRTAEDNYPPLHNLSLFMTIKLLGDSEWSLRLPSVIFAVLNITAVYWLATMTLGRTAGLIGAFLLALSPFHITYSQEARMYSLLALTATLYAASCFYYLRAPSLLRGAWVSLTGVMLLYSHPYGTLNWIAIATGIIIFAVPFASMPLGTMRLWLASNLIAAVGFAPWAAILAHRAQVFVAAGTWIPPPTPALVGSIMLALVGGGLLACVILIGVVLGALGQLRRDVAVFCVWIVVPVSVAIVVSMLSTPIFITRYAIGSLPPLLLLSAFGWTKHAKGWWGAILLTAIVAVAALQSSQYGNVKPDWRGVASFVDERAKTTDCVLVVPDYLAIPLNYYRRKSSCQWGATKLAELPVEIPASMLFLIFAPQDPNVAASTRAAFIDELLGRGWREADRANFLDSQVVVFSR
jgi:mannosyltransferase